MKPNDYELHPAQVASVRSRADRLLKDASAYGVFPTPIPQLITSAKVHVDEAASLDSGVIDWIYQSAKAALSATADLIKQALDKVIGIFDVRANTIYYDHSIKPIQKPFLLLHEIGHSYLPWQKDTYAILEEGKANLEPDVTEEFESEANLFASEVLFQVDLFTTMARDMPMNLATPRTLAGKFGASVYTAIRRYIATTTRCCVILVLEQPLIVAGIQSFPLRRPLQSHAFTTRYGLIAWEHNLNHTNFPAKALPYIGVKPQRIVKACCVPLTLRGERAEFIAEAFNTTHHIFVLLYPKEEPVSIH